MVAFKDQGQVKIAIDDAHGEAERLFPELKSIGVDSDEVTEQLEREGVQLFSESFFALLKEIAKKRESILSR